MHSRVHREHGSNKIDKHLHEGEVVACHHLVKNRTNWEPNPSLVDQLDVNWDMIHFALDKIYKFFYPGMFYLDILGDEMVIPKLVQSLVVMDQYLCSIQLHVLETKVRQLEQAQSASSNELTGAKSDELSMNADLCPIKCT